MKKTKKMDSLPMVYKYSNYREYLKDIQNHKICKPDFQRDVDQDHVNKLINSFQEWMNIYKRLPNPGIISYCIFNNLLMF